MHNRTSKPGPRYPNISILDGYKMTSNYKAGDIPLKTKPNFKISIELRLAYKAPPTSIQAYLNPIEIILRLSLGGDGNVSDLNIVCHPILNIALVLSLGLIMGLRLRLSC